MTQVKEPKESFDLQSFTSIQERTKPAFRKVALLLVAGNKKEDIAPLLNTSKQRVQYIANRLEALGVVKRTLRTSSVLYEQGTAFDRFTAQVKEPTKGMFPASPLTPVFFKPVIRKHNERFYLPVLNYNPDLTNAGFWQKVTKQGKRYHKRTLEGGAEVTLEYSGQAVKVYIAEAQVQASKTFRKDSLFKTQATLFEVIDLLQGKGFKFNLRGLTETYLHTASELEQAPAQAMPPAQTIQVDLERQAEGDLNKTGQALAWIDRSKGTPELESNDLAYMEKVVLMPETVQELRPLMSFIVQQQGEFAKNLALHLEVLKAIRDNVKPAPQPPQPPAPKRPEPLTIDGNTYGEEGAQ